MTSLNLRPVASGSVVSPVKPAPTASLLAPWQFEYASSPDGADINLLVMFHGLGDTKAPFYHLARQLNLPSTAVLSLQAPYPLPLMENPAWTWYNTFTPLFEPLPNPDPTPALPSLRKLLQALTAPTVGWRAQDIHLFGWGQGGTMALELALSVGQSGLNSEQPGGSSNGESSRRLGSVVSVCAGMLSHPASSLNLGTPTLIFTRLKGAGEGTQVSSVKRAFSDVQVVRGEREGEYMPTGKTEWEGIMRFWANNLGRKDPSWKGHGEVFEVVR